MARVLGCSLPDLSALGEKASKEVSISSVCTVFAESEVISALSAGELPSNVAKGAHNAVARRVSGMYHRVSGEAPVVMTGGVALNHDMVDSLCKELGTSVLPVEHCQVVGAIGAAVFAYEAFHKHI